MSDIQRLEEKARELGSFAIRANFLNEDGDPAILRNITWRLTRTSGKATTVVNSRSAVAMDDNQSSIVVALSGNDLRRWYNDSNLRRVTVRGTYDSDIGDDLSYADEVEFEIVPLAGIASEDT